jgi:branched-chain amino acid transport system substrate-binding protein
VRNLWIIAGIFVVVVAAIFVGIRLSQKPTPQEQVIRIGAILPLTGPIAYFGEYERNAIEIAIDEVNSSGGINGRRVQVIYEDHKNDPQTGVSALNKLINLNKVPVVITQMSAVSMAMAPVADAQKVVLVSLAMHPKLAKTSPYVFRIFESIAQESEALAEYAAKEAKFKKIAIIYINDVWGKEAAEVFNRKFQLLGGKVTMMEGFPVAEKEFRSLLLKVQKTQPQATYIAAYGPSVIAVLKQYREMGLKSVVLGNIGMSWDYILRGAGEAAEGAIIVMPVFIAEEFQKVSFVQEYYHRYGKYPNNESAYTYDVIRLIIEAIKKNGYSADGIRKYLSSIKIYRGISGTFHIDQDGDTKMESVAIRIVKNGRLMKLKEVRLIR